VGEWKEVILSEIIELIGGGTPKTTVPEYWGGDIPWLSVTDFNNGRKYVKKAEKSITRLGLENSSTKVLNKGDIIISARGTVGVVSMLSRDMAFNQSCYGVRAKDGTFNDYVYYLLIYAVRHLKQISHGGVFDTITRDTFKEIDILLPPLPEQRAIASVLSSLDDKIDLLHRQNKTLEAMAEALFRQWFIEEAEDWWEKHTIGDFVEVLRGLSYKGSGLTDKNSGIPMHNLNSVYEGGGYKYEGIKYYNGNYKEKHKVFPGDIIITNTEQGHDLLLIGYPAIVPKYFGNEGIFSQHLYRLRIFDDRVTTQYLYYLLMSYDVREQITGATNGSTVNMLPKDGIEWATFKLPPKDDIERFSLQVQQFWDKKELNISQIRTLEKLRDTLLPKLMSGEIRIGDYNQRLSQKS
jgi:type I restriction enzyme S subunit